MSRFEVKDKQRLKNRFPNKIPSTTAKINKGNGFTPKPKEEKVSGPYVEI